MRLVEAGQLDLDAPLRRYLPDLKMSDETVAAQVTLRHLLTHTGGWVGDYFNDFGYGDDALATMVAKVAELPQLTPLGEIWSYNNSGFYLAGRVIEVVTGKPFEAAMQALVLEPLGMSHSFFFAHDVMTQRFAVGHQVVDDRVEVARPWPIGRAAHPAGGLVSTAGDLFCYARFHMGDGSMGDGSMGDGSMGDGSMGDGTAAEPIDADTKAEGVRLLNPESLRLMQTPQRAAAGIQQMGITWFITMLDGRRIIEHGGGTNGQITLLTIAPERGFAMVVLTNANKGGEVCGAAAKTAMKSYLQVQVPEPTPIESSMEELAPYAGRYVSAMREMNLSVKEGALILEITPKGGFPTPESPAAPAPPAVRVRLYGEDRAVAVDPPLRDARLEFLRSEDGEVTWLRMGGRVHRRAHSIEVE
jgi:CubicO group peptidase (beta-lactamase class C family)